MARMEQMLHRLNSKALNTSLITWIAEAGRLRRNKNLLSHSYGAMRRRNTHSVMAFWLHAVREEKQNRQSAAHAVLENALETQRKLLREAQFDYSTIGFTSRILVERMVDTAIGVSVQNRIRDTREQPSDKRREVLHCAAASGECQEMGTQTSDNAISSLGTRASAAVRENSTQTALVTLESSDLSLHSGVASDGSLGSVDTLADQIHHTVFDTVVDEMIRYTSNTLGELIVDGIEHRVVGSVVRLLVECVVRTVPELDSSDSTASTPSGSSAGWQLHLGARPASSNLRSRQSCSGGVRRRRQLIRAGASTSTSAFSSEHANRRTTSSMDVELSGGPHNLTGNKNHRPRALSRDAAVSAIDDSAFPSQYDGAGPEFGYTASPGERSSPSTSSSNWSDESNSDNSEPECSSSGHEHSHSSSSSPTSSEELLGLPMSFKPGSQDPGSSYIPVTDRYNTSTVKTASRGSNRPTSPAPSRSANACTGDLMRQSSRSFNAQDTPTQQL